MMSDEMIETPETCAETISSIDIQIEPEEEELGVYETPKHWEEIEHKFARFERNYRARRIRELTLSPLAPIRKKRRMRRSGRPRGAAV